eukprot:gene4329-4582_t
MKLQYKALHHGHYEWHVFKGLQPDPGTGDMLLNYRLTQGAAAIGAHLTAKLLLVQPGVNGEPDWQHFELSELLQDKDGPCNRLDVAAAAKTPYIWDVYLTAKASGRLPAASAAIVASSATDTPPAALEYELQVLGRCGEVPTIPKLLTVWLNSVQFASHCWLKHCVQTAPDGAVRLGSLAGIKQVCARINFGADCAVLNVADTQSAPTKQPSLVLAAEGDLMSQADATAGPGRAWSVAAPSWWNGGALQSQYILATGAHLTLPLRVAAGQSPVSAVLLQLALPHIMPFYTISPQDAPFSGTPEQLAAVQVVAVFSRFLPDDSVAAAAQLLHAPVAPSLAPHHRSCGQLSRCSYSSMAKLDSAVAYVLRRRQWEATAGYKRPGSLLERPSLLVTPCSIRSAASATSVLRGGDGGKVREAQAGGSRMMAAPSPPAWARAKAAVAPTAAFSAAQQQFQPLCGAMMMEDDGQVFDPLGLPAGAANRPAVSPVLAFMQYPAAACDAVGLTPGMTVALPGGDASEAAEYCTTQQLYALLAALLDVADMGGLSSVCGKAGWGSHGAASGARAGDLAAMRAVLPQPCAPQQSKGQTSSSLLREWEPLLVMWPQLSPAARLELLGQLGSAEMAFFLACKDRAAFDETGDAFKAAKRQLLQHWLAPHRHQMLTVLEKLLLAALEGREALARFAKDVSQRLETPAEKRGAKRSWMSPGRRDLFDLALLISNQLASEQTMSAGEAKASGATDVEPELGDDFVMVQAADAALPVPGAAPVHFMRQVALAQPAAAAPQPMVAGSYGACTPQLQMGSWTSDLQDRAAVAVKAAANFRAAPKETKEWTEAGWWKWGGQAPPSIIPESWFWVEFAQHLASATPGQLFIPLDPTGVAASTGSIVTALAVCGLPWEGQLAAAAVEGATRDPDQNSSSSNNNTNLGCSRSYSGSTMTLSAQSPCLVWVKQVRPIAKVPGNTADATAASGDAVTLEPGPTASSMSPAMAIQASDGTTASSTESLSSTNTVMVTQRLYDPQSAVAVDAETGEQLLLSLAPSDQEPLLTGQRYCTSIIITSISPSVQLLDVLVQLPQGALPLCGLPSTISSSIALSPYASQTLESSFYFPRPGVFKQAPVSVTRRSSAPTSSPSKRPEPQREFSWSAFLTSASPTQVLEYLRCGDLSVARVSDIAPLCRDKAFFQAAVAALNARHVFDHSIWIWAVTHLDEAALAQLLPLTEMGQLMQAHHLPVDMKLLQLDGADCGIRHLEYWPWVNPYCRPVPHGGWGAQSGAHLN